MYLLVDLPMHLRNFKISNQPKEEQEEWYYQWGNSITSKLFGGKSSKTSSNNKFIDIANLKRMLKVIIKSL